MVIRQTAVLPTHKIYHLGQFCTEREGERREKLSQQKSARIILALALSWSQGKVQFQ
jgi:hypothetical protein